MKRVHHRCTLFTYYTKGSRLQSQTFLDVLCGVVDSFVGFLLGSSFGLLSLLVDGSLSVFYLLVDSGLTTTSKGSTVNIDRDTVEMFKGFVIEEYPDSAFQTNEWVYAYPVGVAKSFTGIVTARAIESEDFDGVALQGYGKAGEFIPVDNKAAVLKATYTQST